MAAVEILKPSTWETHHSTNYSRDDALVDEWLMMSGPTPVIMITLFYLYFVISLGPKIMINRKPFQLKYVMIIYNFYQVAFSSWMCMKLLTTRSAFHYLINHFCIPMSRHENPLVPRMNDAAWWYFMSKVIELLDTVFFILRKKHKQVTVLHVYHHTTMVVSTWAYLKYIRGEQAFVPGVINCMVHVVMYSYYLLAALGPRVQKYLWWKKYLTKLQLTQFIIILLYMAVMILLNCNVPHGLTMYMSLNTVIFLILFLNFYHKSYKPSDQESDKDLSSFVCIQQAPLDQPQETTKEKSS